MATSGIQQAGYWRQYRTMLGRRSVGRLPVEANQSAMSNNRHAGLQCPPLVWASGYRLGSVAEGGGCPARLGTINQLEPNWQANGLAESYYHGYSCLPPVSSCCII